MPTYSVSKTRKTKVPNSTTSVLTVTSKMPGPSYSLPAGRACPNAWGDVCDNCYAKGAHYQRTSVKVAQDRRFKWTIECLKTAEGRADFIDTMVLSIQTTEVAYFRGHDSGDFFNVAYIECWIEVCKRLPAVKFWFPTREYQSKPAVSNPLAVLAINPRVEALKRLAALANVTVRPSALAVGAPAPVVEGLAAGSAVNSAPAFQCPAYTQGGECRDCRHCWDSPNVAVSYPLH